MESMRVGGGAARDEAAGPMGGVRAEAAGSRRACHVVVVELAEVGADVGVVEAEEARDREVLAEAERLARRGHLGGALRELREELQDRDACERAGECAGRAVNDERVNDECSTVAYLRRALLRRLSVGCKLEKETRGVVTTSNFRRNF